MEFRCEGEGVGGSGSGREMPESGLMLEDSGEFRGPVEDELASERWGGFEL